jgi:hypothetical protein
VVPSPAFEQEGYDCLIPLSRGPADDVALVHIAAAVNVGTGVEQHSNAFEVTTTSREMQRRRVIADVAQVRIGAMIDQQLQDCRMTNGLMQAGAPISRSLANEARIRVEQRAKCIEVATRAGLKVCLDGGCAAAIDLGFQCSPARKAVFSRNRILRVGKSGDRIGGPQLAQPLFGQLLQILERRAIRELRRGHRHLPSTNARVSPRLRPQGPALFLLGHGPRALGPVVLP